MPLQDPSVNAKLDILHEEDDRTVVEPVGRIPPHILMSFLGARTRRCDCATVGELRLVL